ncbi:hypothetical protein CMQ_3632 [Grosmannia clavigera kw1407]|uniref:Uncharacterized protein n=1 Tax=Grosmannia clavigera (strain kw1407 / UAMH 11150) TaxID=655863 RepID=F0X8T0_GROCL|nr:uncharacterized protein CMQ_3632 [Grosmannia clavigera kw1407]EFX05563.1 hypothetical protein CMQ_3632 [Grosmannia clavigera kw1407]
MTDAPAIENGSASASAPEIHVAGSAADARTRQSASDKESSAAFPVLTHTLRVSENVTGTTSLTDEQAVSRDLSPSGETISDSNSVVMAGAAVQSAMLTAAAAAKASALSPPPPATNGQATVTPATAEANGLGRRISLVNGTGRGQANGATSRGGRYRETPRSSLGAGGGYAAAGIDLDAISYRQLNEDVDAYAVDLDFCDSQLAQPDLTPQEMRTLQLRRLDLGHQIRFSQHRREMLEAQRLLKGGRPLGRIVHGSAGGRDSSVTLASRSKTLQGPAGPMTKRSMSVTALPGDPAAKRVRAVSEASGQDTISVHSSNGCGSDSNVDGSMVGSRRCSLDPDATAAAADVTMLSTMTAMTSATNGTDEADERDATYSLQRLGFWKCRLCTSEKYLMAGAGRQPSAPSKWPLKDMGKLMSHYFDMHTEHEPDERCAELGDALDRNRGPFEYWLRKSRAQRIPDRSIIDQVVQELQDGRVPKTLRDLCRAAAAFPGA